jgi:hypothetical protein
LFIDSLKVSLLISRFGYFRTEAGLLLSAAVEEDSVRMLAVPLIHLLFIVPSAADPSWLNRLHSNYQELTFDAPDVQFESDE